MTAHKKAPQHLRDEAGAMETITNHKDNIKLPRLQMLVYNLLLRGEKYSVADISIHLHLSDPRSHIAQLRKKGITVSDEWCTSEFKNLYKRYWIVKETHSTNTPTN